ncbi:MAG: nucleotidyltransferase domain-containing protein [bacterium]|nr:nucleotidyltransferase domain-containing protein [bacterium]MDE0601158.1 nucleotidyltransferase domain-containing protein [bacterium]
MHPRVPSNLASIRNFASSAAMDVKSWSLDKYWRRDRVRDGCNRYLMWVASHLTTVSCLDPETAASISNLDLLIERGLAVMPHYRWVDSNYNFYHCRESKDQVDEYTVFWTIKDYFPTLAREIGTLLAEGAKAAMEKERCRKPYNPFSEKARQRIAVACRNRGARSLTLYGSYADGTQGLHSQIDFLAEMNPRLHPDRRIRKMIELQFDLELILNGRVNMTGPHRFWDPYEKDSIENCSVLIFSREDPGFRSR